MGLILRKETPNITRYKLKPEYKNLLMTIQALPGVHVLSTILENSFEDIKSGWSGVLIFLHVEEYTQEGLFFLTRSMDKRYWEYGNKWRIELSIGDSDHENGDRPIIYQIFRPFQEGDIEKDITNECKSLVKNMMLHFNHDDFMRHFNMDRGEFHLVDEVAFDRRSKIEDLGI